eukprot:UN25576
MIQKLKLIKYSFDIEFLYFLETLPNILILQYKINSSRKKLDHFSMFFLFDQAELFSNYGALCHKPTQRFVDFHVARKT